MFRPQIVLLPLHWDIATLWYCSIDFLTGFTCFFCSIYLFILKYLNMDTKGRSSGYYFNTNSSDLAWVQVISAVTAYVPTLVKCCFEWISKGNSISHSLLDANIIPAEFPVETTSWLEVEELQSSCQTLILNSRNFLNSFSSFPFCF